MKSRKNHSCCACLEDSDWQETIPRMTNQSTANQRIEILRGKIFFIGSGPG